METLEQFKSLLESSFPSYTWQHNKKYSYGTRKGYEYSIEIIPGFPYSPGSIHTLRVYNRGSLVELLVIYFKSKQLESYKDWEDWLSSYITYYKQKMNADRKLAYLLKEAGL